ncbi:MAG TPA: HAMP domain-containing sensor histidine kinase [Caulobacteraceae bacterium]|jgi:signal transduction histidine kinase|uniref:sensor histidine kinase n=1 Tax=Phenylobacterium sp. TaxID=1871053 RepID=UPI002B859FFF|nr:HAMP domain-containing sensor histidine kinase [Phenylobacterium sp.]HLZ82570.1 HAMP domain-containing sensor histidine kinase [Caulobacteraceae bacterium]HXA37520.1 HAMP domain-containing sensor histidine kinase [Phenylobacterium sp.]
MSVGRHVAGAARRRVQGLWRRTGVRLAAVQMLVVLTAFGTADLMARAEIRSANEATLRHEITGEMASLQDEITRLGASRLPGTVDRRTRLWRGFDYGLDGPDGERLAGRLSPPRGRSGWSQVNQPMASGQVRTFLVLSQRTPQGGWLFVGKDLAGERRAMLLVTWRLLAAGACGAAVCLAGWVLFFRSAWRRLEGMSDAARLVAEGRLNVRAPAPNRRTGDDIDGLSAAFNAMLERIGGLIDQLRRVTTDVAHDLRTPLTRMRQRLEALERARDLNPPHRRAVRAVHGDLMELLRTFDALLQLAEIESRRLADEGIAFDLAEIGLRVAQAFQPDLEASGRRLEVTAESATVVGDPALLTQMLANLVENGLRHTPTGSVVRLGVEARDGCARLTVSDDGPGVPAHMREAVLTPYFRLDQSRGSPGSGLGLSIVAAIAARHEARLSLADNAPGLVVTVSFPEPRLQSSPEAPVVAETGRPKAA